jgi:hypothetical protein
MHAALTNEVAIKEFQLALAPHACSAEIDLVSGRASFRVQPVDRSVPLVCRDLAARQLQDERRMRETAYGLHWFLKVRAAREFLRPGVTSCT